MSRVAVVGSRDFPAPKLLWEVLEGRYDGPDDEIISGGARGIDTEARKWAEAYGVHFMEYPADWEQYGKAAGFIRNADMVRDADKVIAFWDGQSRGTKHTIDLALKMRVPVEVYFA